VDPFFGRSRPSLILKRAHLAMLRGEVEHARETLEALAPRTRDVAPLEARRAMQIAGSYLYEERYDQTHAWVERSRAASKTAGLPVETVATILDVRALLGLGEIRRAEEVFAREAKGRPHETMLEVAILVRRGEPDEALAVGEAALPSLDRRADLLFRSIVAVDLARASIATSQLAQAAELLRLARAGRDERGLAVLRPLCDAEEARLAEARGDGSGARSAIDRAYGLIPRSPWVAIDHAAIHGEPASARDGEPPAAFAYSALRAAELDVVEGKLDSAIVAAQRAERFYGDAGMLHETARAAFVLGEAFARRPAQIEDAERALEACESLARANEYPILAICAALVRAYLSEVRGNVVASVIALEEAVRIAAEAEVLDAGLERAARRYGVSVAVPRGDASAPRPFEPLVERLGLARFADVLWRIGDRTFLRGRAEQPPENVACTVDLDERKVEIAGGDSIALPAERIALLVGLVDSGVHGVTLEELFALGWKDAYDPVRHRNSVCDALTDLEDSLRPLTRDVRLANDGERCRLLGDAPVAVRRRVSPGEIGNLLRDGGGPIVHD
jgi:hypothetical protein